MTNVVGWAADQSNGTGVRVRCSVIDGAIAHSLIVLLHTPTCAYALLPPRLRFYYCYHLPLLAAPPRSCCNIPRYGTARYSIYAALHTVLIPCLPTPAVTARAALRTCTCAYLHFTHLPPGLATYLLPSRPAAACRRAFSLPRCFRYRHLLLYLPHLARTAPASPAYSGAC